MRRFSIALCCCALWTGAAISQAPDKAEPEKPSLVFDAGGHTATVRKVLFTPDGEQVITISYDKTVRIWDAATGEPLRVLRVPVGPGIEGNLVTGAISPDGKRLAVAGMPVGRGKFGLIIYVIALDSGRVERVFKGHTNGLTTLAFSPDGNFLASAGNDKMALVNDMKTGKSDIKMEGHTGNISSICWSPDGKRVATASMDRTARIWSATTGKMIAELKGHTEKVNCVAWSPDGKTVATGSADHTLRMWDPDGTFRKTLGDTTKEEIQIVSLCFRRNAPDLLYTGIGKKSHADIIDLTTGNVRFRFTGHSNTVQDGDFSPDGKRAVTTGGNDHESFVWKTDDASVLQRLQGKGQSIWGVGWSPDGKSVAWGNTNRGEAFKATAALERSFRLSDLEFGELPNKNYRRAQLTSNSRSLELNSESKLVIKDGDKSIVYKSFIPTERVLCSTMLGEKYAVIGTGYGMYAVEQESGKVVHEFLGHTGMVMGVALSPDGRYLLSGGSDQTLRIWDPNRKEPLLSIFVAGSEWVAWTPEGYYAASAYGERLMGWLVNKGPKVMAVYHPAVQFRKSLYRPDVIKLLLPQRSLAKALAAANKDKKTDPVDVSQVLPPDVTITSPATPSGTRISGSKLEVKATARSTGKNPVTALRLLVDGRPAKGTLHAIDKPKAGEVSDSWTVELTPGKHTLAVQAESDVSKGLSSFVEVTRTGGADAELPALYVLAVGVSDYPGRLALRYAAEDAEKLSQAFQKKSGKAFRKVEVKVLKDKDASRRNILEGLAWLESSMTPQDVAVFSFSGHGARAPDGRFFFISLDVDADGVPNSASSVSGDDLKKALANIPGRIITILDACHSGAAAKESDAPAPMADLVRDLVTDDYGVIAMCSSLGREYSLEGEDVQAGYFTHALVEGLSGAADLNKDGVVQLHELERYTALRVPKLTRGLQHPVTGHPATIRSFPLAVR